MIVGFGFCKALMAKLWVLVDRLLSGV